MPWQTKKPDLKNDPRYLEGKVNDTIALLAETDADVETLKIDKASKSEVQTLVANKAEIAYVDSKLAQIGDAKPSGVYATVAALQTAFPSGNGKNIYLVTADGKWYYWNGTSWLAGGVYQSTVIADETVTLTKLSKELSGLNNFVAVPTFVNGVLTKVEELDGGVVKKRTSLAYNTDGTVNTITALTTGKTVITTMVYTSGVFTSASNQLIEGGL